MSEQVTRGPVRRAGWWIGAVVGVVAAVATGMGVQSWQEDREAADLAAYADIQVTPDQVPPPADTIRELLEQEGPLVVHPDVVDRVDPADLRRARRILERADQSPVRRVAYFPRAEGLEVGYTTSGALAQWMHGIGEVGHYVMVFEGGFTQTDAIGLESEYVSSEAKGQPGPALVRVATEVAEWETEPEIDRAESMLDGSDYWGGPWGGLAAGALIGSVTVVPLWGLAYFIAWQRGQKRAKQQ